jgi:lysozyme-like protein
MATLTINQAATYARTAGFSGDNLITILAIAMAESGLNTTIQNSIGATGILQIYLAVHPDVSYAQAIDPGFSFRYAWKLSNGGQNFCPWQSYDSNVCGRDWDNRYKQFLPTVRAALGLPGLEVPIQTVGTTIGSAKQILTLSSNASVAAFLNDLDGWCTLSNPFDIDTSAIQTTTLGGTFTNPIDWLNQFGNNLISDSVALILRTLFLIIGAYMIFRVIDHYLNISGMIEQTVSTVGKVGAL